MLFLFFFTKFDQMSRVGSRDRHAGWRSKIGRYSIKSTTKQVKYLGTKVL